MPTKFMPSLTWIINASFVLGYLLASSCSIIKPNTIKSGKRHYETFYVGDEGTQYFIKSLVFESITREYSELDFTFRYQNELKDSATINISIYSDNIFRNIDSLRLYNGVDLYVLKKMNLLFTDRYKTMYKSRFSGKLSPVALRNMFLYNNWELHLYSNSINIQYSTPKNTRKKINKLNHLLFDIF